MSECKPGTPVSHPDFGDGTVLQKIGAVVRVDFFGEPIDVSEGDLTFKVQGGPKVADAARDGDVTALPLSRQKYFTSIEAINLGVVPPDPDQLLHFTMNGAELSKEIRTALDRAPVKGLSKVVLGNYGTGKTHYLQLVRAVALKSGWIVAFVEFDPKAADPAKPHLVYRHIMSALEFPPREDGSAAKGFIGFVKEVRAHWMQAGLADLPLLKKNPWFLRGLRALMAHEHDEENEDYLAGCAWLAGDSQAAAIKRLAKEVRMVDSIPRMPASKEAAEIYAFHLAVVDEIAKKLGYKGLLLILDEAEHVRGYSTKRQERANHFFDYLARCAHVPMDTGDVPAPNEHGHILPEFWSDGPRFGLYVGLTPADGIPETREECVFIRSPKDVLQTTSPGKKEYAAWSEKLLEMFSKYCPEDAELFSSQAQRKRIAGELASVYSKQRDSSTPLRNWIKLGGLACSIPLVDHDCDEAKLIVELVECSEQIESI